MNRRNFIGITAAIATGGYAALKTSEMGKLQNVTDGPPGNSAVAVLKAPSYSTDLVRPILEGARACGLNVRGKRVLLKPNLVEFDAGTCINTDARVIAAAYEAMEKLGAAEILIGEGPGHRRDTYDLASGAQYFASIPDFERRFTDLNRDDVRPVSNLGTAAR